MNKENENECKAKNPCGYRSGENCTLLRSEQEVRSSLEEQQQEFKIEPENFFGDLGFPG